jgi:transposase-like protein
MSAQIIRYSEAFKRKVVEELEKGELRNQLEARERYGIGGGSTIHRWLRKYGKNHLVAKVVKVESMKERDRIKQLKRKIRELEKGDIPEILCLDECESYYKPLGKSP